MEDFSTIGPDLPDPFRLLVKESVASTNDEARLLGEAGSPEGLIVLAHNQTQGRGRRGAAWFSPPGESLAFSVLLRPETPKALWPRLALASGLAVAEAIEAKLPLAGIKWPNDVWIGGKKIAGILVEAGRDFVVVGIGLNVNTLGFPPPVSDIATSLASELGTRVSRPEILAGIVRHLSKRSRQIDRDFHSVMDGIRLRCVLTGKRVTLQTPGGTREGEVTGLSDQGELRLRTEKGIETFLQADEVRIVSGNT